MQLSRYILTLFYILISSVLCFSQNVLFLSQSDVDAFDPSTTVIEGNLYISSDDIDDLSNLTNLISIGGFLQLEGNSALPNLNGFSNLTSVGDSLYGEYGDLTIQGNDMLTNLDGLSNLTSIGKTLTIGSNDGLLNVDGLSNLTSVGKSISISNNSALLNVDGFSNLTSIAYGLTVNNNNALTNLTGFSNLTSIGWNLSIYSNNVLDNCCGIQFLLAVQNAIAGSTYIQFNFSSCNSPTEIIEEDCGNNINIIEGNVFLDISENCLFDQEDIQYENIIIEAESSEYTYTTVTDNSGNYKIYLDTGAYVVKPYITNPYIETCTASYVLDILDDTVGDTFSLDFPTILNAECPYLEVDISTWALRECFDNTYYIQYCNSGTKDADNAYIELDLDDVLSIADASIPYTGPDINNIYTFQVGTVAMGDCNSISLNIQLPCDTINIGQYLGQTFCIDAHIYPDSICLPPSDIWDGSSVHVSGECNQDSVTFRISNIGVGDMDSDKSLQVFEDQVMFISTPFQLQSGEEIILSYFANGSTFRLDAEQSDGHPGNSNPSAIVEGCGDAAPMFSLGFINQFPQDDGDVFVSTECREVTASYDPNDKQAFPVGYGVEHFIEQNTDIEYLIRFQNTGTDTAFTVVVTDEISPLLDITTINPGASSHPYVFEIDSVVRFTFNDILLVDSLTNEPASHGFVKFRISQQPNLSIGSVIGNTAKIYFDFNAPIITNTTFHTIGEDFVEIDLIDDVMELYDISSAKAYPNPFDDFINFEVKGNTEELLLSVFDVSGKLVAEKRTNEDKFQFHKNNLQTGIYFYTLSIDDMQLARGKMIIH